MQCDIRKHDVRQFEIKVSYPLDRHRNREQYRLEVFLFMPYQIGVNSQTYSREQFYDDLRNYTRFKTPPLTLEDLLDGSGSTSPLNRIARMIEEGRSNGAWHETRLIYELKLTAVLVRVNLRDACRRARDELRNPEPASAASQTANDLFETFDKLASALERFRTLKDQLSESDAAEAVKRAARLADEFASLQVEGILLWFLRDLEKRQMSPDRLQSLRDRILRHVRHEQAHRERSGCPSHVSGEDARSNEYFLHREGLLKKFCSSVLFLSVAERPGRRRVQHTIYAIAAGLAMAVGVAGLWVASQYYERNTLAIGLVIVILYMIRDRLKDVFREIASQLLPRWTCDRRGRFEDRQSGRKVGATKEAFNWRNLTRVSGAILQARRYEDSLEREVAEPNESVMQYEKQVRINSGKIYETHERLAAVDDIFRIQVGHWLHHMDDPRKMLLDVRDDGRLDAVKARRGYHVNMVVRLHSDTREIEQIQRARLILSRRGIERLELP